MPPSHDGAPRTRDRERRGAPRGAAGARVTTVTSVAEGSVELLVLRVGGERFAIELRFVEEALECPPLQPLPDMERRMLGIVRHRARTLPVYAPEPTFRVSLAGAEPQVVVVRAGDRAIGIAADEVEDVVVIPRGAVRPSSALGERDGVLHGVAMHEGELVAIVDARALVDACAPPADLPPETL